MLRLIRMSIVDQAVATQLKNIETKTGKSFAALCTEIRTTGLVKHGEIRDCLKQNLSLGHGDANALALHYRKAEEEKPAAEPDLLDTIYSGPKAALRPIHERLMAELAGWGEFEIAPKKGYVSLRRKKQFAMLGPATNTKVELGLNMKDVAGTERLLAQAPGGMCQYKVRLGSVEEVDQELLGWLRKAYEFSGA